MTTEIAIVLSILVTALILFTTEWVRMDVVALLVMGSLALTGLVSPAEALSGFSNPAVVTVWAILILSGALARTGVAGWIGRVMLRLAGESEMRLLIIIILTVGVLSGFMNSIGVASLFLPVVIDIAHRRNQPPSRYLMPLAFAALLGGMTTLIGTPPNILISEALREAGLQPFMMFDYTPVGIAVLLGGSLYMLLLGRHLLPQRDIAKELTAPKQTDVKDLYDLQERMVFLHLPQGSALAGKTLAESRLGAAAGLNVIAVMRNGKTELAPDAGFRFESGDRLLVEGDLEHLTEFQNQDHLVLEDERFTMERLISTDVDLVEARLSPSSDLVGQTLRQIGFRHIYKLIVLAIRRGTVVYRTNLESMRLQAEDTLLIQGHCQQLNDLRSEVDMQISRPESLESYNLEERLMMVRVPDDSTLVGKTLVESRLGDAFGLGVLGIVRAGSTELMPAPDERLQSGDTLLVKGKQSDLLMIEGLQSLEIETEAPPAIRTLETEETGLTETVLSPRSSLVGKTLRELNFRAKYGLNVLAIWREGRAYRSNLRDMPVLFGDALLLYGPRRRLRMLGSEPDFLVLTEEAQPPPRIEKAPIALLVMALVLVPVIFGWVPIAISVVLGVSAMILTGCLTMEEAYRSIDWQAVFLIAGMLPLGIAMQQTGAASFLGNSMINLVGGLGVMGVLSGLFFLTALSSQIMPNPAVTVLMAPIALNTAANLGVSPYPLMMAVAIAASSAFLTPVAHAANVLVMGPGGYRFSDYMKVGFPLLLVVWLVMILVLPIVWPF